jgi:hypothetical protein
MGEGKEELVGGFESKSKSKSKRRFLRVSGAL